MDGLADTTSSVEPTFWSRLLLSLSREFQTRLDSTVRYWQARWIALGVLYFIYILRVYLLQGFYVVTYALGIFELNLLIGFLSPQEDPENEGLVLPTAEQDEFKPFVRRLPEFKFW